MVRRARSPRARGAALLALLALAAAPAGSGAAPVMATQELPAGVASDLVDRALEQELDAPPPRARTDLRTRASRAIAWFALTLALLTLAVGWRRRAGAPHERAPEGPTASDPAPGDAEATTRGAHAHPEPRPAAPTRALALPSHVTEVLERAARKRAAGAGPGPTDPSAPDPGAGSDAGDDPPGSDPPDGGLDYVVPGYDPWKGG